MKAFVADLLSETEIERAELRWKIAQTMLDTNCSQRRRNSATKLRRSLSVAFLKRRDCRRRDIDWCIRECKVNNERSIDGVVAWHDTLRWGSGCPILGLSY